MENVVTLDQKGLFLPITGSGFRLEPLGLKFESVGYHSVIKAQDLTVSTIACNRS